MKSRNLAYIALLAGWLCFCYWLYGYGIVPRLQYGQEKFWPEYSETLLYPLAYTWASASPLSGSNFGALKAEVERLDSTDEVLIVRGYYFRDELEALEQVQQLAHDRIDNVLKYLRVDELRIIKEVDVQPINGDVRANPFEAIRFERIEVSNLMTVGKDTFELCFPLKDSLKVPAIVVERFLSWMGKSSKQKNAIIHVTGTADGGGIAESSEIALERALYIKEELLKEGWEKDQIRISSGQRNHPLSLRNRCVVVYFE